MMIIKDSSIAEDFTAFWQFVPMVGPAIALGVAWLVTPQPPTEETLPDRLKAGRNTVRFMYNALGVINSVLHIATIWYAYSHSVTLSSILDVFNYADNLDTLKASPKQLGYVLGVYFLQIDIIGLFYSLVYWSALESGVLMGFLILVAGLIVGPAASVSWWLAAREMSVQTEVVANATKLEKKKKMRKIAKDHFFKKMCCQYFIF